MSRPIEEELLEGDGGAERFSAEDQIRHLIEMVEVARAVPMSSTVMVHRDEMLDVLDELLASLPDELRAARWLLKEREEVLERAERERSNIIAEAKTRLAHMVEQREVTKQARLHAQRIIDEAEAEARAMKRDAEDYCDQKLASFEVVLDRLAKTVAAGRRKLAVTIADSEVSPRPQVGIYEDEADSDAAAFFDQDLD
ncbi:MAG: ATP synthase F0 subunit B [Actinobacteria bacterium]|nr:ATP synthase F0 subunit B [Actinomycetota bacterium]